MSTPAVRLAGVDKAFGDYTAVRDVHLDAAPGEFVAVVGPSGCGKSTLLNMAAGLSEPTSGIVEVHGHPLVGINRDAGYIFQGDALLPWKTVEDNIELGLKLDRRTRVEDTKARAREWVDRVGLGGFASHYPAQLSGGMRKRVAIAQTWIRDPDILLMDEPFSALDIQTRQMMENELLELWSASRKTVLFVTHDLDEAIALADRVVLLSAGPASTLLGQYPVELDRPRDLMEIRMEPAFTSLYQQIWTELREEVLKSHERAA